MSEESFRERAEMFTRVRLQPIWDELTDEEKEKLIDDAEELFKEMRRKKIERN